MRGEREKGATALFVVEQRLSCGYGNDIPGLLSAASEEDNFHSLVCGGVSGVFWCPEQQVAHRQQHTVNTTAPECSRGNAGEELSLLSEKNNQEKRTLGAFSHPEMSTQPSRATQLNPR